MLSLKGLWQGNVGIFFKQIYYLLRALGDYRSIRDKTSTGLLPARKIQCFYRGELSVDPAQAGWLNYRSIFRRDVC